MLVRRVTKRVFVLRCVCKLIRDNSTSRCAFRCSRQPNRSDRKALRSRPGSPSPPSSSPSPPLSVPSSLAQQVLLSYAARVNSQDVLGNTPLHYAAENGDEDTIDLLLSVGCETTLENKQGKTPVQILPEFPWQEAIARGTSDPPPVTATNVVASEVAQWCLCFMMLLLPSC
jgi:ankyrin repeat protein